MRVHRERARRGLRRLTVDVQPDGDPPVPLQAMSLLRTSLRGFGLFKQTDEPRISVSQRYFVQTVIAARSIPKEAYGARFMKAISC
jgi:hypothetical protein